MSYRLEEWLDEVALRMQAEIDAGVTPQGEQTTARELLGRCGYERRGMLISGRIRGALEDRELHTSPDFEYGWIDRPVTILLDGLAEETDQTMAEDPTVRVEILRAAHKVPTSVQRDDSLAKATTIMQMEDYSQLPVMPNSRDVKGVVSWKSIGAAHAKGENPSTVRECMEDAHVIDMQMPLVDAAEVIGRHDYVLVRDHDRKITGIVTAVDLAHQFKERAHPFLLIGEIEHHLRNLVRGRFPREEFVEAAGGDDAVHGPDDLTLGGYGRLVGRHEAWERLGVQADRVEFVARLETVRQIRNEVMHFSAEACGPEEIHQLECMARFCRGLIPYGRTDMDGERDGGNG